MLLDLLYLLLLILESAFLLFTTPAIYVRCGRSFLAFILALSFVAAGFVLATLEVVSLQQYLFLFGFYYIFERVRDYMRFERQPHELRPLITQQAPKTTAAASGGFARVSPAESQPPSQSIAPETIHVEAASPVPPPPEQRVVRMSNGYGGYVLPSASPPPARETRLVPKTGAHTPETRRSFTGRIIPTRHPNVQGGVSYRDAGQPSPSQLHVLIRPSASTAMPRAEAPQVSSAHARSLGERLLVARLLSASEAAKRHSHLLLPLRPAGTESPLLTDLMAAGHQASVESRSFRLVGPRTPVSAAQFGAVIVQQSTASASKLAETKGKEVYFTTYYPPRAEAQVPQHLYVYAHILACCQAVRADVNGLKNPAITIDPHQRHVRASEDLKIGAPLTVRVRSPQLQFEPTEQTQAWSGEWQRFSFPFVPPLELLNRTINIEVSIWKNELRVGYLVCAVQVIMPTNPLARTKLMHVYAAKSRTYFVSYSRKDTAIVRAYCEAHRGDGDIYFIDTENIPPGALWETALALGIDQADVFKLFWSTNSAASENVRHEYLYALQHRCLEGDCKGFICPVFWEEPIPKVPWELQRINFTRIYPERFMIAA